jgi:hypothetical protein
LFEYFYFNRVQLGHASECTPALHSRLHSRPRHHSAN